MSPLAIRQCKEIWSGTLIWTEHVKTYCLRHMQHTGLENKDKQVTWILGLRLSTVFVLKMTLGLA